MSLKAIHIFFIAASIALSTLFGAWQIGVAARSGTVLDWFLGVLSVLTGLALVLYLFWFVRHMRNLSG